MVQVLIVDKLLADYVFCKKRTKREIDQIKNLKRKSRFLDRGSEVFVYSGGNCENIAS
jgi:hypothetical protein